MVSQPPLLSEQTWRQISCCTYICTLFIAPQLISSHETIREHLLLLRAFAFTELCEHNARRKSVTRILPPEWDGWFRLRKLVWINIMHLAEASAGFTWTRWPREPLPREALPQPEEAALLRTAVLPLPAWPPSTSTRSTRGLLVHTPSWSPLLHSRLPRASTALLGAYQGTSRAG